MRSEYNTTFLGVLSVMICRVQTWMWTQEKVSCAKSPYEIPFLSLRVFYKQTKTENDNLFSPTKSLELTMFYKSLTVEATNKKGSELIFSNIKVTDSISTQAHACLFFLHIHSTLFQSIFFLLSFSSSTPHLQWLYANPGGPAPPVREPLV